jgi:hypothetical protein
MVIDHLKSGTVGTLEVRIDKFMLHLLSTEIHQFPMGSLAE